MVQWTCAKVLCRISYLIPLQIRLPDIRWPSFAGLFSLFRCSLVPQQNIPLGDEAFHYDCRFTIFHFPHVTWARPEDSVPDNIAKHTYPYHRRQKTISCRNSDRRKRGSEIDQIMNLSIMWIVTFVGIIVVLLLLVASTAFRCLSSNTLASILQIGAIVTFIVLFAFLMIYFLSSASDHNDNLEQFTRKAKARAKSNYLRLLLSSTMSSNISVWTTASPVASQWEEGESMVADHERK